MSHHEPLPDQAERDRFQNELERNFSVIAPAGVGKTTAIVERIGHIAETDDFREHPILPKLVLVTYTKKAAAEMRDRARQKIVGTGPNTAERLAGFNSAFFGTIHSFCLELLRRWGFHLGLSPELELVEDDKTLWLEFLRDEGDILTDLPPEVQKTLSKHVNLRALSDLARHAEAGLKHTVAELGPVPKVDISALLSYEAKRKNALKSITETQARLRSWVEVIKADEGWAGIPIIDKGGKEFVALGREVFSELRDWLGEAAAMAVEALANRYRQFRIERGQVRFDDMISLAQELLTIPAACNAIRAQGYRLILDEAQDTDPVQFDVLLSVAQSTVDTKQWKESFPEAGRFCMVGDPQQSIYADRADIHTYLRVDETLRQSKGGEAAEFTVTMRCDKAVVDWVNTATPAALNGSDRQVSFVPLHERPWAGDGDVSVIRLTPEMPPNPRKSTETIRDEAKTIAEWLSHASPSDFGATDWSKVALLCPRKSQLAALAEALEHFDIPVQNHSRNDTRGDDPAIAWVTALIVIFAEPDNVFEIAGVLREIFALSDESIAQYVRKHYHAGEQHPLNLGSKISDSGPVSKALKQLDETRKAALDLPLRSALHRTIEKLQLSERIQSLPNGNIEGLESLVAEATTQEEAGSSLSEWAIVLKMRFTSNAGEANPEPGKIQLLTCQKAKGLQWGTVILPFFFSKISPPRKSYPASYTLPNGRTQIAIDKEHLITDAEDSVKQRTIHSLERLLYVAMTRSQQRLIIIDDEAYFPKGSDSFAEHLRITDSGPNRKAWESLTTFIPEEQAIISEKAAEENKPIDLPPKEAPLNLSSIEFIKRTLPSSLANHDAGHYHDRNERDRLAEPDYPEVSRGGPGGADYGNWWHDAMEVLPWEQPMAEWKAFLNERLSICPFPERGQSEIDCFIESEIAQKLSQAEVVRTEIPIVWRANESTVYDGSIDLAAMTSKGKWLLVDWKTDRVGNDPAAELLASYGPQLAAYRDAVTGIFATPEAMLYSTRTGICAVLSE
ncbi:UvrD-helicase domain-containing protein [Rubellicoccus peritrichatus]|uniref:DNA 3'-5' helicase n=1 Tax=Rubellicoccus peritrichatus TaxID=3080537 RepID=A0AAQ3LA61_9BACT|nr:UvrD-helicase domain-containing protein [Puniceicoccus sp. CR14]WOO41916.1 UvrD-helicase domain-containing protein [Puniceicoccus sp. CR14]